MKVTSGVIDSRFGVRFPGVVVPALLALGIALTLLLIPGSATAGGQGEFIVPIVLEEGRSAPNTVNPTSVPVPPQVRTEVDPPIVPPPPQVQTEVEPTSVPPPQLRQVINPTSVPPPQVRGNGVGVRQTSTTPASTTLISNKNKGGSQVFGLGAELALSFTTGSNSFGYRVTRVDLRLNSLANGQSNYSVSIRTNSSGVPGTTLGTLTYAPALPTSFTFVEFPASGNGIDLDANTTYWMVASGNTNVRWHSTSSDAEDSNGAAGWSIGNKILDGMTEIDHIFRMAVIGYAKTEADPPRFTPPSSGDDGRRVAPGPWITPKPNRADLSGTNVIVSMDKAVMLDSANYTTAQLAAKFTVWVNGDRQAIVGASVSGYQVTLDLGSSFSAPAGARVAVSYARGPLLDAAAPENRVGGFSLSPGLWITPRPNRVDATATGVVVSMDKAVQLDTSYTTAQLAAAFTVRVNGTAYTPTGASVSRRDIRLDIGHPTADGDKLDVDYRKGPLQDSTGMRVSGFNYYGVGR